MVDTVREQYGTRSNVIMYAGCAIMMQTLEKMGRI